MEGLLSSDGSLQQLYIYDEKLNTYKALNIFTPTLTNQVVEGQQLVYYTAPTDIQPTPNTQTVTQYASTRLTDQNDQKQQRLSPKIYQPADNTTMMPASVMINPTDSSTPIITSTKRGRNDTSGISESHIQVGDQQPQATQILHASNAPTKRLRGMNQQTTQPLKNPPEPSAAACRFATTRFPFSPFVVIYTQAVRDNIVIDDLTKHAREVFNFELKLAAYRRGRVENNEHRILIFVENSESFAFLYNQENWPKSLAGYQYTTKRPSIPPQLALVIPAVSLLVDWDDFTQELKNKYPDLVNVVRLKNQLQQPIRAVKLEFMSVKARHDILEANEITALHLKYKVVEFYAQANVLICSNCYGIGHFRKSCPQKDEATCKTCGERSTNLKDHNCSGVTKCIHCSGAHVSNDPKCRIIQQYRANLTRNLLLNVIPAKHQSVEPGPLLNHYQSLPTKTSRGLSYANVVKMIPSNANTNSNDTITHKLDSILAKVEEESNVTRQSLIEFKQEIRNRYDELKQQVEVLNQNAKVMERKLEELSMRTLTIIQNICTTLHDPVGAQGQRWKSYWQKQIKTLEQELLLISAQKPVQ